MKVIRLNTNPGKYSSNSYLILGTWNKLSDVNTLVDTGSDDFIVDEIETTHTGVGKKSVDRIILTHSHFDHVGGVKAVKKKYNAEVLASTGFEGVDRILSGGESLLCGDSEFKVINTPGHSSDSICLYSPEAKVLFSGDTSIRIFAPDQIYTDEYIDSIEKLASLKIEAIYPGHGDPLTENPESMLKDSLRKVKSAKSNSIIIKNDSLNI